jgi:aconitate hydratase
MPTLNSFGAQTSLEVGGRAIQYYSLRTLEAAGFPRVARLPFSIKVLLENLLRREDGRFVKADDVRTLAGWDVTSTTQREISFMPARVLLQDFTGVPCVVDLAAMRDGIVQLGGDPNKVNPLQPVELVIDHSVQVDYFAQANAFELNAALEFSRNKERYALLRWGQNAFRNFRVVPPDTGIVHQVNIEYLARVVVEEDAPGGRIAYPDTLVGTDSHTTMVNGLGVVGWGVGGIEAEAAMLGQPISMLIPQVLGFRLRGRLPEGVTATDLVLTITERLRKHGVVGKFVEFFGPGLEHLTIADRATLGNMCPEYGATIAIFPVDAMTLDYLRLTGRDQARIDLVEAYARAQGMFRTSDAPEPVYTETIELDLSSIEPSLAGPRRPQDRVPLAAAKANFQASVASLTPAPKKPDASAQANAARMADEGGVAVLPVAAEQLEHGSVVIAAITSCTNTSNPSVMIGAGLVAKKAVERGLTRRPWVKTSLAPGSKVVSEYLAKSGLQPYLDQLGFNLVGYGCTTCIGNSGPLPEEVSAEVDARNLVVASVLSGNRNFEGRIHPEVRANYLASPPLVIAYGLAGTIGIDLDKDPLGRGGDGRPVYLRDIWPTHEEVRMLVEETVTPALFREEYANVYTGNKVWNEIRLEKGDRYRWQPESTYIRQAPFFEGLSREAPPVAPIRGARVLAFLGDSVTTDHISPAGMIPGDSPAADWLRGHGVDVAEFNTFGSRRGNHEVMMRGTFGNIRIRNRLAPGKEGGYTRRLPDGPVESIYDAAMSYRKEGVPLLVIAGKDYGMGSSRDWAAKGAILLGVRAVLAESFERIHRSNLIGMGVLPLVFVDGQTPQSLGLTGEEVFEIEPVSRPGQRLSVSARAPGGEKKFTVLSRIDAGVELDYYRNGGILHTLLRSLAG